MGSKKKPLMPRRQRKSREEERKSGPGGAQEEKKSCDAPPPEKKQGRREKIRPGRGMGSKKKPLMPRRQRKNREEEGKSVLGGAWGAKRSL